MIAGEVGRTLNINNFDLHRLFVTDGVQILHISGLIAALSEETSAFCLALVREAKNTILKFHLISIIALHFGRIEKQNLRKYLLKLLKMRIFYWGMKKISNLLWELKVLKQGENILQIRLIAL